MTGTMFTGEWFGVFSITWWPLCLIWFIAVGVLMVRWLAYGHRTKARPTNYSAFFRHVSTFLGGYADSTWSTGRVASVVVVTGVMAMGSVVVGDHQRNQPCRQACKDAGWSNGRYRMNPHDATDKAPYACWCHRGSDWSEAAIAEDVLSRPAGSGGGAP